MNLDPDPRVTAGYALPANANVIGIRLSRRNLEVLLAKLDTPGSHATLLRQVADETPDFAAVIVVVKAEEDGPHYSDMVRQADVRGKRGATVEDGATSLGQIVVVPA